MLPLKSVAVFTTLAIVVWGWLLLLGEYSCGDFCFSSTGLPTAPIGSPHHKKFRNRYALVLAYV